MSLPDRPPASATTPPTRLSAALREDGRAPRSPAQRLLMLGLLTAISLSVAIPTLIVTGIFGQRPRPKAPPPAVRAPPAPATDDGLLARLQQSAGQLLPDPPSLGPEPITVPVRPEHVAARVEKIQRQAAQFGGTATEGLANGGERHLFVDLPATATAAFRLAVTTRGPSDAASPVPPATAASLDHIEVIIRPAADDE